MLRNNRINHIINVVYNNKQFSPIAEMVKQQTDEVWRRFPRADQQASGRMLFLLASWYLPTHTQHTRGTQRPCTQPNRMGLWPKYVFTWMFMTLYHILPVLWTDVQSLQFICTYKSLVQIFVCSIPNYLKFTLSVSLVAYYLIIQLP